MSLVLLSRHTMPHPGSPPPSSPPSRTSPTPNLAPSTTATTEAAAPGSDQVKPVEAAVTLEVAGQNTEKLSETLSAGSTTTPPSSASSEQPSREEVHKQEENEGKCTSSATEHRRSPEPEHRPQQQQQQEQEEGQADITRIEKVTANHPDTTKEEASTQSPEKTAESGRCLPVTPSPSGHSQKSENPTLPCSGEPESDKTINTKEDDNMQISLHRDGGFMPSPIKFTSSCNSVDEQKNQELEKESSKNLQGKVNPDHGSSEQRKRDATTLQEEGQEDSTAPATKKSRSSPVSSPCHTTVDRTMMVEETPGNKGDSSNVSIKHEEEVGNEASKSDAERNESGAVLENSSETKTTPAALNKIEDKSEKETVSSPSRKPTTGRQEEEPEEAAKRRKQPCEKKEQPDDHQPATPRQRSQPKSPCPGSASAPSQDRSVPQHHPMVSPPSESPHPQSSPTHVSKAPQSTTPTSMTPPPKGFPPNMVPSIYHPHPHGRGPATPMGMHQHPSSGFPIHHIPHALFPSHLHHPSQYPNGLSHPPGSAAGVIPAPQFVPSSGGTPPGHTTTTSTTTSWIPHPATLSAGYYPMTGFAPQYYAVAVHPTPPPSHHHPHHPHPMGSHAGSLPQPYGLPFGASPIHFHGPGGIPLPPHIVHSMSSPSSSSSPQHKLPLFKAVVTTQGANKTTSPSVAKEVQGPPMKPNSSRLAPPPSPPVPPSPPPPPQPRNNNNNNNNNSVKRSREVTKTLEVQRNIDEWQKSRAAIGNKARCIPVEHPTKAKNHVANPEELNVKLPDFPLLVNFPEHLTRGQTRGTGDHKGLAPEGKRHCVMCGQLRICSSSANRLNRSTAPSEGNGPSSAPSMTEINPNEAACSSTVHIIPRQNKGVCTACDVTVWTVVNQSDSTTGKGSSASRAETTTPLEIKWCKGCKNFRPWPAFGDKGLATKCARCRHRQREKYALQKKQGNPGAAVVEAAVETTSSSPHAVVSSPAYHNSRGRAARKDDDLLAAQGLSNLMRAQNA